MIIVSKISQKYGLITTRASELETICFIPMMLLTRQTGTLTPQV